MTYQPVGIEMVQTQKQLQSAHTRQHIITTAARLFARKGFHGTSMSDLTAATGLTKGALYHHFASKDALFFEVVQFVREKWADAVAAKVMQAESPLDQLSVLLDRHAQLLREEPTLCLVITGLTAEMAEGDPRFLEALHGVYAAFIAFTEEIVRAGQAKGQVRADVDARLIAVTIVGLLRGLSCFGVLDDLNLDCELVIQAAKPVFLNGLRSP